MAKKTSQWRKNDLKVWDYNMLVLAESVTSGKTISQNDFFLSIGFNPTNISQIYSKKQSFSHEHFDAASKIYNISMDWFYGFTGAKSRKPVKVTVEKLLKEALELIKMQKK